jgi:prevent-host-death family protein
MRRYRQLAEGDQADLGARRGTAGVRAWKLEDAKARFSELVRRAQTEGPQRVTVRGKDAVVVVSADDFERLLPARESIPFVEFMESLYVPGFELSREPDRGRDPEL